MKGLKVWGPSGFVPSARVPQCLVSDDDKRRRRRFLDMRKTYDYDDGTFRCVCDAPRNRLQMPATPLRYSQRGGERAHTGYNKKTKSTL